MTPADRRNNETILTVEDDPVVRDSIAIWLEDAGFDVLQADNGLTGLQLFRENKPDAVLLDLGIPGIEGKKLLELLSGESPETPVIIVSGRADIDDAIDAFKSGAWDYITKPIVNLDMLEKTVRNCLEHKSLKERVVAAENRYYNLVQSLPVVVFAMNERQEITFINTTSHNVLGYTAEAILAEPDWFRSNVHRSDKDSVKQAFENAFSTPNEPFSLEFQFQHGNGYLMQIQARSISVTPADTTSRIDGRIEGVFMDITERAFLDKVLVQREKLNTLGAMADEIAHEFRNPIFALGGFARRLKQKQPDLPEAEIILEEAQRLEQLLDKVKDYLKPVDVRKKDCSLNAIVQFCVDMLRPRLAKHSVTPMLELDQHMDEIQSDQDILTQVGMNLLSNALLQMPEGETLHIRSYATLQQQSVEIIVSAPSGVNKSPDSMLMPFDQQHPTQNLAVSYRLVKNVDGFIAVKHENDVLTITLSLPVDNETV